MSAGSEREIARIALEAARSSTCEAGGENLKVAELGLLNEQWTHSYVGDAIAQHLRQSYKTGYNGPFVTYETSVSWIEAFFEMKRGKGRIPGKLTDRNRFDITVWSKGGKVAGLIEIKDDPVMQHYSQTRDPLKLAGALRRWPKLKWGMFLFSVRQSNERCEDINVHLCGKISKIRENIRLALPNFSHTLRTENATNMQDGTVMWAAMTLKRL